MIQRLKSYLKDAFTLFGPLLPALLITLLFIRIFELYVYSQVAGIKEFTTIIAYALLADLFFFFQLVIVLFLLFLLVGWLTKGYQFLTLYVLGGIWILINVLLVLYFLIARVPMGADLFGYSMGDSYQIALDSVDFDFWLVLKIALPLLLFYKLLVVFSGRRWRAIYVWPIILLGLLFIFPGFSKRATPGDLSTEFTAYVVENKGAFFIEKVSRYVSTPVSSVAKLDFVNPDFPFLREDNTPDVLSDFFEIDSAKKPDFVFIQVEGLGRAFSGPDAYLGSFTPFIDELAQKSLYFTNFLSAQGRTFATLPSILGSLPFAESGFSDLDSLPKFYSLINILSRNGYHSRYYGGFEMDFDHQGLFMKRAGTDQIVSASDFDKAIQMASPIGYGDRDLIDKVLSMESTKTGPSIAYIQTISMHNPFTVPDQERFNRMVEARMDKMDFSESRKTESRIYKNVLSTTMYTDEALRFFFQAYAKLPEHANTIFIITGDHRLPEIPLSTKIDRYHVPLIIYSPMLKKGRQIHSISSHLDMAPSFVALLRHSYHFKTPSEVTWVGTGLDLAQGFRNIHQYPLKQGKTVLHNYVDGLFFLDDGKLFQIQSDLDLVPVNDADQLAKTKGKLNVYKAKNEHFLRINKLYPDSTLY